MSANQKQKRTLVESETALRGSLSSSCPVVVLGAIDGDVTAPALEVAESGVVSGRVKAAAIASRGELAGLVEADTVQLAGRLRDGTIIRASSLDVQPGADPEVHVAFGDCELEVGEMPSKEAAIRRARGLPDAATTDPALAVPQPIAADASGARSGRRRAHHDRSGETGA